MLKKIKNSIKLVASHNVARLIAKSIDLFIVLVLSFFLYPMGLILGILYIVVSDSMQNGQSAGKSFIGFKVISNSDGSRCSIRQSAIRNLPIIIPLALAVIPIWGWILSILIGPPLIILEVYLIFTLDTGKRLGDVMADTTVVVGSSEHTEVTRTTWFSQN